jgi:hypothetical protein
VGLPVGNPPPVISSRPTIPVIVFGMPGNGLVYSFFDFAAIQFKVLFIKSHGIKVRSTVIQK